MHTFCGKNWSTEDLLKIRALIERHPTATRAKLSRLVCEQFNWLKPDGKLKDMSCRVAMLKMHRANLIELPAPTRKAPPPYQVILTKECDPGLEFNGIVNDYENLHIEKVQRGKPLKLWNQYIARYHYLGYKMLPGAQIRYFIKDGDAILGAMGFGAAAWKVAPRDKYIGWDDSMRKERLHLIVNQSRFLILPWIHCRNLASKSLSLVTKRLPDDWAHTYNYRPALMETFVEIERFSGGCYKADNWLMVGQTQGRGKLDRYYEYAQPIKSIWLKPLTKNFCKLLGGKSCAPM